MKALCQPCLTLFGVPGQRLYSVCCVLEVLLYCIFHFLSRYSMLNNTVYLYFVEAHKQEIERDMTREREKITYCSNELITKTHNI